MTAQPVPIRIGSRGSALALRQTETILERMRDAEPGLAGEIVRVLTHGDRFAEKPIREMGAEVDKGIFNTALEDAVLAGEVDLSTCSFKDVQSELREDLAAVSVAPREDHRDVLVTRHGQPLAGLPEGAILATSSPRRISQLKTFRPDFRFVPLRGNVTTRVEREAGRFDGVVLAAAGLIRLGLTDHIVEYISEDILLPAPAQGAMGCEYRKGNERIATLVQAIQHPQTERCVQVEKTLLVRLSGGCFAPVGVLARMNGDIMNLRCRVASLDGQRVAEAEAEGPAEEPGKLLDRVEAEIASRGGKEIVQAVRAQLQG